MYNKAKQFYVTLRSFPRQNKGNYHLSQLLIKCGRHVRNFQILLLHTPQIYLWNMLPLTKSGSETSWEVIEVMLKYQRSFLNLKRATVVLNHLHVRRKSHCINTTVIPAPFCGSPTIVIRSPYSVKVKPIDPVEYGDMKAVIGFLYLQTETDEEITERDKATLNEHIKAF